MTTYNVGRWLLVGTAILGIALLAPVVGAHGSGATAGDAHPYGATAAEWTTWMEARMTEHMGPGAVEWMEAHMGVTVDEMARDMADGNVGRHAPPGGEMYGAGMHGAGTGMYGAGGC